MPKYCPASAVYTGLRRSTINCARSKVIRHQHLCGTAVVSLPVFQRPDGINRRVLRCINCILVTAYNIMIQQYITNILLLLEFRSIFFQSHIRVYFAGRHILVHGKKNIPPIIFLKNNNFNPRLTVTGFSPYSVFIFQCTNILSTKNLVE